MANLFTEIPEKEPVIIRKGETIDTAVTREILNTRTNVGILDASTLGKIMVKGPDAGKFLDLIYTNIISTLKIGQCRYGLMCNENGFLFDDGVVVRINNDTFICHTTSGGSDRVYSWMEEVLFDVRRFSSMFGGSLSCSEVLFGVRRFSFVFGGSR